MLSDDEVDGIVFDYIQAGSALHYEATEAGAVTHGLVRGIPDDRIKASIERLYATGQVLRGKNDRLSLRRRPA